MGAVGNSSKNHFHLFLRCSLKSHGPGRVGALYGFRGGLDMFLEASARS